MLTKDEFHSALLEAKEKIEANLDLLENDEQELYTLIDETIIALTASYLLYLQNRLQEVTAATAKIYKQEYNFDIPNDIYTSEVWWPYENFGGMSLNERLAYKEGATNEQLLSLLNLNEDFIQNSLDYIFLADMSAGIVAGGSLNQYYQMVTVSELANNMKYTAKQIFRNNNVNQVNWVLSGSHPRPDICDTLADNGPYDVLNIPAQPHPNCMCYLQPVVL